MHIQEENHFIRLLVISGAVLALVVSIFFYNLYIGEEIDGLSDQNLEQLVNNNAETFQLSFETNVNLLESAASLLPVWDYLRYIDFESDDYQYLARSFDYMVVVNPSGYAVGSDGEVSDLIEREYFHEAMDGATVINEPLESYFDGKQIVIIATPMIAHGETRGVLAGFIYVDTLDDMFDSTIDGLKANLIVDSEGNIISNGVAGSDFIHSSNMYDIMKDKNLNETEEFQSLQDDIANNMSGRQIIKFDDEEHSVIYEPIGIEDWVIVSIIPESVTQATTSSIVMVTAFISVGIMIIVAIFAAIINSTRRRTLEKVAEIAYVSQLTGINTLIKFKLDVKTFVRNNTGKKFLLVKLDIENFRLINESLSEKEGDRILKKMAKAISYQSTYECIGAHIHADEFLALIAYDTQQIESWRDEYAKILQELLGEDFNYKLKIVAGYYYLDTATNVDISTAIERVNIAHHLAKETKSLLRVYSEEVLTTAVRAKEIENRMEEALENGEFLMVLQPELELSSGKLMAAEALVRWKSSEGFMQPDEFISIFEDNGFVIKLDMYMFEQACQFQRQWIKEERTGIYVSVNFSRKHLYTNDFVHNLVEICEKYQVSPQNFGIEITETSMLNNDMDLNALIAQLQSEGFRVLMDDFGSGYSSLGLIKNTSVDVLKLDKSFFNTTEINQRSIVVVKSVIQLAKGLGMQTVAEGIETLDHVKLLKQMECDYVQGYYYAKPMQQEEFVAFYDSEKSKMKI